MFGFARYDRHAGLVSRMAETLGIDLAEEAQRGNLPPEALRGTVHNCLGCRRADGCEHWLEVHSGGAVAAPGYCRNAELLAVLARA